MKTDRTPEGTSSLTKRWGFLDGGRLELKTPLSKGTLVVLFVVRKFPDDMGDSDGGIRKRPDFRITRSMILDWNYLSD